MIIEVYDGDADDIQEGQLFKASIKTVGNETIVTLDSQEETPNWLRVGQIDSFILWMDISFPYRK